MTIATDFHSHIVRSSATQMAQSAQSRGIRILGLSEHVFQMREARPLLEHMILEGPLLTIAQYSEAVRQAAEETGLDIRLGLEIDFIPEKNQQIQAALQGHPWDFLIGSVHETDGRMIEPDEEVASREEGEQLWRRYFHLLRETVRSGYFDLVSHPVRMRVRNPHLPITMDDELEQLAMEATQHDVALEINGSDILHYPDLVRRLAIACIRQHTPISVGSDAHNPTQVARGHQRTIDLLREVGGSTIRIWKQRQPDIATF